MMYPYSYEDVLSEHKQVLKDADTFRRHFGTSGPSRFTISVLTFGARVARRFAVRLERTAQSLGGGRPGSHTSAAA